MTRNTDRRVEVACPVYDPSIRKRIHTIIDAVLHDTRKARVLLPDGMYGNKDPRAPQLDSQLFLMQQAQQPDTASSFSLFSSLKSLLPHKLTP